MKDSLKNESDYFNAIIKTAQYLATLTKYQNFWIYIKNIIREYYDVDFFYLYEPADNGKSFKLQKNFSNNQFSERIFEHIKELLVQVMDSSFIASELINIPESYAIVLLPVIKMKRVMSIMVIGHQSNELLPKFFLNMYLSLARLVGTTIDNLYMIEELKNYQNHLEDLVNERTCELKEAQESLRQFVSTVSHEIGTPLTVLKQSLNLLKSYSDRLSEEERVNLFNRIEKNTELMIELREDLLILSSIDEHRVVLDWIRLYPYKIIQEVLDLIDIKRKNKNISIDVDVKETLVLFGDIKRLGQIFRIFIDNAIKYSEENSSIKVIAIEHYKGKYNLDETDCVLFQVIDNGRGIHKEKISNLFQRFYRCPEVKNIPGTGLGLCIAKEFIELHKGHVFVESEYGKGTTFSFFLPRLEKPP
jgi:signal transduction histidine kinase